MTRSLLVSAALAVAAGCYQPESPPPPPPLGDAAPRRDAGPFDAGTLRRDAGPETPVIDGRLDEGEWRSAAAARADVSSDREGSRLRELVARVEGGRLYLGVDVTLGEGDALVGYVDGSVGEPGGVSFGSLDDRDQPLDDALSVALDADARFGPELGFGTTTMGRAAVGRDAETGWRALAATPASFTWLSADEAPMVCGERACEASILLDRLSGAPPRSLGVFVRIVGAEGALSNQTLPLDEPTLPERVAVWLEVEDGVRDVDGGTSEPSDAGVPPAADGGDDGIVIDGVLGTDEWTDAVRADGDVPPAGAFGSDRLSSLYALRTEDTLYLAVVGAISDDHAIVAYVDRDLGRGDGLASPTALDDTAGALDLALSRQWFTAAELRIDFAWGTLALGTSASDFPDRQGWRNVGLDPTAFERVIAPSVCGVEACETSVSLAALGVVDGDEIAVFARLVDATSDLVSNQTLPVDDPGAPELVDSWLVAAGP